MNTPAHDHPHAHPTLRNPIAFISEHTTRAHLRQIQYIRLNKLQHEVLSLEILSFFKEKQVARSLLLFLLQRRLHMNSVSLLSSLTHPQMGGAACISLFEMIVY